MMWRRRGLTVTLAALLFAAHGHSPVLAHAGHDAEPAGPTMIAPRAEVRVGAFEVVVVFSRQTMAVFVHRYSDSTPVVGAKVEVTTDLQSASLSETDAGVYVTSELLMSPGTNEIEVNIAVGGVSVRQSLTLEMPHEAAEVAASPAPWRLIAQVGVGSMLLGVVLVGGLAAARRRKPVPVTDE